MNKGKSRSDMNAEDKGLGQTIEAWFLANDWAQTFPEQWAKAHGRKGPHASQISFLKQRKLEPRAGFFKGLGDFNRAVFEGDVKLCKQVTREKLQSATALIDEETGEPFGPMDFLGLYLGLKPIPAWLNNRKTQMQTLQSDIDVWAEGVQALFGDACLETFTNAQDYWGKVKPVLADQEEQHDMALCQKVVLGLAKPTAEQVLDATDGTAYLAEAINDVFRKEKGEDLSRIVTLRELGESMDQKVEMLSA